MDLHSIVRNSITRVNKDITATLKRSQGVKTLPNGKREPAYYPDEIISVQKQQLTQRELMQLDSINQQGVTCSIYLYGNQYGVMRSGQTGGDLLEMNGQTWKVVQVLEAWDDWCKLALVLQQI